jgi:hypothetical protein
MSLVPIYPANKCYETARLSDSSRSNLGDAAMYAADFRSQDLAFIKR